MSFINRVWDTQAPGTVSWISAVPDTGGALYPGPGTFGTHTSNYRASSLRQEQEDVAAQLHDLSYGADEIYQFNGNLNAEVGVIGAATMLSGAATYGPGAVPGTSAIYLDGVDDIVQISAAPTPTLGYVSNFTIEMLVMSNGIQSGSAPPFGPHILRHGEAGEAEPENITYDLQFGADNELVIFYEHSTGVNDQIDTGFFLTPFTWHHIAYQRFTTVSRLFVNGTMIARATDDTATGGTNSALTVGGNSNLLEEAAIAVQSVKFVPSVLTPGQILAEARRTLPPGLRP